MSPGPTVAAAFGILTPDQRPRVFISSTLVEMAPEREAAKRAVECIRLIPVMSELGARPHPARSLYRAYLAQSHVFVGLYAQRYGWVAPAETVSGLEDEYQLSRDLPRLVYLRSSDQREERLEALLDRIREDDTVRYKCSATPRNSNNYCATISRCCSPNVSWCRGARRFRSPLDARGCRGSRRSRVR